MGFYFGLILTVIYIAAVTLLGWQQHTYNTSFNEWGDYIAGAVQPIALMWFIATLYLQRKELALQREELRLTREAQQGQQEQQQKIAEANLEANRLASKSAFIALQSLMIDAFEMLAFIIHRQDPDTFPKSWMEYNTGQQLALRCVADQLEQYIAGQNHSEREVRDTCVARMQKAAALRSIREYSKVYEHYKKSATQTDNEWLLVGYHSRLFEWISILNRRFPQE